MLSLITNIGNSVQEDNEVNSSSRKIIPLGRCFETNGLYDKIILEGLLDVDMAIVHVSIRESIGNENDSSLTDVLRNNV